MSLSDRSSSTSPRAVAAGGRAPGRPMDSTAADEAELVARFWDRLRLFGVRRLGDARAADDLAQETLRRVIEAIRAGRLADPAALPGFVFGIAQRICLQHRRSAWRESRAFLRLVRSEEGAALPAGPPDPLVSLIDEERRAAVRTALARLADADRELLRLLYFEYIDPAVVAQRFAITIGALRVRKHRALRRLSELLETDAD